MVLGQHFKILKDILIVILILSSLVLSGCGGRTIKHYSGPELAADRVATLHIPYGSIKVQLDGKSVSYPLYATKSGGAWYEAEGEGMGGRVNIKILPGRHDVKLSWRFKARDFDMNFTVKGGGILDAQAGKIYVVKHAFDHGERESAPARLDYDYIDEDVVVYQSYYNTVEIVKVKDSAIWIEEVVPFGKSKVVVGNKPSWVKW